MENASKALLMAGEILIAIIIIALLVFGYNNIRNLSSTNEESKKTEQLAAFNKEYESYNKKLLRGVDVISLINKASNNNKKYENEAYYKIEIEFMYNKKYYTMNDYEKEIKNDEEKFTDLKRRIFDCKKITYSKDSGRVNKMYFEERIQDNYDYGY